jgi:opacity protein-like surface antigen
MLIKKFTSRKFNFSGKNSIKFSFIVLFSLFIICAASISVAEASEAITGITPSNNYNQSVGGTAQAGSTGSSGNITGLQPPVNGGEQQGLLNSKSYYSGGNIDSSSPFRWWGVNLDLSPFVSQNYSNPISQLDNISDTTTGINNESVTVPLNYSLNNSNFNGNGLALRYHSFNHIISVGDFLPPPISWILFFIPSIKDKYYYSSSNFNLSYVDSSNLTMNTTDATITGKMQEVFLRYYWNPLGVDYPISLDNNKITLVPYADLGVGGFTDFFYAHDFTSNNPNDLLYVALTNPQAANDKYAQGLYGLGLRYGLGVQVFAKHLAGQVSFHILPYDFKRGFAAPGFIAANQGASLPSPSMTEDIFDVGVHYNFISNWYVGLNYEHDSFHVGSIGQTPVTLSNVTVTQGATSANSRLTADNFYNGGTMTNNYLYLTVGYNF